MDLHQREYLKHLFFNIQFNDLLEEDEDHFFEKCLENKYRFVYEDFYYHERKLRNYMLLVNGDITRIMVYDYSKSYQSYQCILDYGDHICSFLDYRNESDIELWDNYLSTYYKKEKLCDIPDTNPIINTIKIKNQ